MLQEDVPMVNSWPENSNEVYPHRIGQNGGNQEETGDRHNVKGNPIKYG